MNENDEILILKAWVEISSYRLKTVLAIGEDTMMPTQIATKSDIRMNHISTVLKQLKDKNVAVCLNENAKKGRLYKLTDLGLKIYYKLKMDE